MEIKEIIETLESLGPKEKLDDHLCEAIFNNYDELVESYPFGKYRSLGKMLEEHCMRINSSYIKSFKDYQTYYKIKPFIASGCREIRIVYDAMFKKEGWAEEYDEYLSVMAQEVWESSPCFAVWPDEDDIEATKYDCQLKYWNWAFMRRYYLDHLEDGLYKNVKNPVMHEFMYEKFLSDGYGTSNSDYPLAMVGILRHRSKPMAVITSNTPRKLFEELIHGRYDYFEQILDDFNLYTESWSASEKNGVTILIQDALEAHNHPLRSVILKHFKKSRENATMFVEKIIARGYPKESKFFTKAVLECIDVVALCKKGIGIVYFLKYSSWPVFNKILKKVNIELIVEASAGTSSGYYEYQKDPFEYLGLERAYILLRAGAFIDIKMPFLEINQQHQNLDTVMKCISADKLPHLATILEVIVNRKIPKIALPSAIQMGDKMVRQVDELPAGTKYHYKDGYKMEKPDGKTGLKLIRMISKYSYLMDNSVHDYVHWQLWNMAKSGQLTPHDLRTLPFKLVDEVESPLPNNGLTRKLDDDSVTIGCPPASIDEKVELETPPSWSDDSWTTFS